MKRLFLRRFPRRTSRRAGDTLFWTGRFVSILVLKRGVLEAARFLTV